MKNRACTCEKWKKNTPILDGMIEIQAVMSWGNPKGYTGDPFQYCPWCGEKLMCLAKR